MPEEKKKPFQNNAKKCLKGAIKYQKRSKSLRENKFLFQSGSKWLPTASNGLKWIQMAWNGSKWLKMDWNGLSLALKVLLHSKQDMLKCAKKVPKSFWFKEPEVQICQNMPKKIY